MWPMRSRRTLVWVTSTPHFADHTTVFEALVLAAQALVILYRPEDTGAEQTITFRLESPVVDGFRFLTFTERPERIIRGGQTDLIPSNSSVLLWLSKT